MSSFFEHMTSVSGDGDHLPIVPGTIIDDMISSLTDDE